MRSYNVKPDGSASPKGVVSGILPYGVLSSVGPVRAATPLGSSMSIKPATEVQRLTMSSTASRSSAELEKRSGSDKSPL